MSLTVFRKLDSLKKAQVLRLLKIIQSSPNWESFDRNCVALENFIANDETLEGWELVVDREADKYYQPSIIQCTSNTEWNIASLYQSYMDLIPLPVNDNKRKYLRARLQTLANLYTRRGSLSDPEVIRDYYFISGYVCALNSNYELSVVEENDIVYVRVVIGKTKADIVAEVSVPMKKGKK